jgi:hypothetical protein
LPAYAPLLAALAAILPLVFPFADKAFTVRAYGILPNNEGIMPALAVSKKSYLFTNRIAPFALDVTVNGACRCHSSDMESNGIASCGTDSALRALDSIPRFVQRTQDLVDPANQDRFALNAGQADRKYSAPNQFSRTVKKGIDKLRTTPGTGIERCLSECLPEGML